MATTIQPKRNFTGSVQVEGKNVGPSDIATLGEFGCQTSPGLDTTASAITMGESRTLATTTTQEGGTSSRLTNQTMEIEAQVTGDIYFDVYPPHI